MIKLFQHKLMIAALTGTLALGGAVTMVHAQTPAPEPSSLSETYGAWVVRCVSPAAVEGQETPARICEMTQELSQQGNGQRVLAAALQNGEAGATLTLVAPFGLLLSEGVKVAVDEEALTTGAFRTCLPGGCLSVIALDQASVDTMAAGEAATVTMRTTNEQDLNLNLSLSGFTAAWNRLKAL